VTTLNALVALVAEGAGVPAPARHLPVWPFCAAGAVCEAICAPLGIEPPIFRRRVDFSPRAGVRHHPRRDELGFTPRVGLRDGIRRTLDWYPDGRMAVSERPPIAKAQEQLFAAGKSSRAKYTELIRRPPGPGRLAEIRAHHHVRAGVAGSLGPGHPQGAVPDAARLVRPQRRVRPARRAAAPAQGSHRSNVAIDDHCLVDAKGESIAASGSADGVSSAQTSTCRARTATSISPTASKHRLQLRVFSAAA
jgi:hypothetical protein